MKHAGEVYIVRIRKSPHSPLQMPVLAMGGLFPAIPFAATVSRSPRRKAMTGTSRLRFVDFSHPESTVAPEKTAYGQKITVQKEQHGAQN